MLLKKIIETVKDSDSRLRAVPPDERIQTGRKNLACAIRIDPKQTFQRIEGFGGALTESAGFALAQLPPEKRREALAAYFSPRGNGYTLARTHMNSCDFSLENWACVEQPDETLDSFSMERADRYLTPLIKDAQSYTAEGLRLFVTPWSPPAWMKDNNEMNHGGKLLKKYYPLWAAYFARFIAELKKRGIAVWAVSVQNEPAARQTWDSCEWTGAEEGEFAAKYLGPALAESADGGRIKIFVWDHNRDVLFQRFSESMAAAGDGGYIDGAAFHWYSGDQYDNVEKVSRAFPGKLLIFSEGCVEGGPRPGAWFSGERYAHNIINDLNHGCNGWIDWNIALDMQGGPNHVGNYCDAPILVDAAAGALHYQSSYYYIGHFSRFIRPGSRRAGLAIDSYMTPATVDGRMGNNMEFCAFINTDNSLVIVALNRTEADMAYELSVESKTVVVTCPPRGIQTLECEI